MENLYALNSKNELVEALHSVKSDGDFIVLHVKEKLKLTIFFIYINNGA